MNRNSLVFVSILSVLAAVNACSSAQPVKTQNYARLNDHRTFEFEFPVVWKGIESALKNYKITDRDPSEVDPLEMQKLDQRSLETDWVYGQSRDKYHEYAVNGSPRKKYLQTRIKYAISANRVIGGVDVTVKPTEEVEKLKADGSSAGWESVDEPDSSRPNELLDKINLAILSAAP